MGLFLNSWAMALLPIMDVCLSTVYAMVMAVLTETNLGRIIDHWITHIALPCIQLKYCWHSVLSNSGWGSVLPRLPNGFTCSKHFQTIHFFSSLNSLTWIFFDGNCLSIVCACNCLDSAPQMDTLAQLHLNSQHFGAKISHVNLF